MKPGLVAGGAHLSISITTRRPHPTSDIRYTSTDLLKIQDEDNYILTMITTIIILTLRSSPALPVSLSVPANITGRTGSAFIYHLDCSIFDQIRFYNRNSTIGFNSLHFHHCIVFFYGSLVKSSLVYSSAV